MWWVWVVLAVLVTWALAEFCALRASGVHRVEGRSWRRMTADLPRPDLELHRELSAMSGSGSATDSRGDDGAFVDRSRVDRQLLEDVERAAHATINARLDLRGAAGPVDDDHLEQRLRSRGTESDALALMAAWTGASSTGIGRPSLEDLITSPADDDDIPSTDLDEQVAALHEPFTPDLLADHGVTVTDGVALSDMVESSLSHASVLLGAAMQEGVDGILDEVLLGLGAAKRVMAAGARERQLHALHGDALRSIKNTTTDAGLTMGGRIAGAALLGPAVGGLIDVATLGTTCGAGALVIGPAIMGWLGGSAGAAVAEKERMRPLTDARAATSRAVEQYDRVVAKALSDAGSTWTDTVVPLHERVAVREAVRLRAAASRYATRARRELDSTSAVATGLITQQLEEAMTAVDSAAQAHRWSLLVQRRVRSWRVAALAAVDSTPEDVLPVLVAAPGAAQSARELMTRSVGRRATVLAAVAILIARLQHEAGCERDALIVQLTAERERLVDQVRAGVEPALEEIRQAAAAVRRELVHTGARSKQWVEEHLPPPARA